MWQRFSLHSQVCRTLEGLTFLTDFPSRPGSTLKLRLFTVAQLREPAGRNFVVKGGQSFQFIVDSC